MASIQFDPWVIWEVMLELRAGWNMVSLPVCPDDMSAASDLGDIGFYPLVTWSGNGIRRIYRIRGGAGILGPGLGDH